MLFVLQTLYTFPENFRAYKALIAAQYSDVNIKVASEPPEFTFGETNKTDAFLKKFPLGRVRLVRFNGSRQLFIIHNTAFERSGLKSGPAQWPNYRPGREGGCSKPSTGATLHQRDRRRLLRNRGSKTHTNN